MRDPRLDRLAAVIVDYSCAVRPGQIVRLTGDPIALPLLTALYEKLIRTGAHPVLRLQPDAFGEIFLRHASDEQLKFVSPLAVHEIQSIDVSIGIWAETNTKAMTNIDPKRQAVASSARKPIFKVFMERAAKPAGSPGKLAWCGTLFPTAASAQDAEMSLTEYEDFVFAAGHLDKPDPVGEWKKIAESQERLKQYLTGKKIIRFQAANGTDLTVNVESMLWVNCCGHENFPDGEVFTGPNLKAACGGVNGYVKYHFPAVHHGREVHDIELWFEKGRVVKSAATRGENFLLQMLDQDPGARNLGEIAIGTNYNIQQYTKNTLFDEKIGGTFHAAVGAGYPETGNTNESGLHWDMVCDLRAGAGGGTITVDGQIISRDGKFLDPTFPSK
jgi:aminopeptidase